MCKYAKYAEIQSRGCDDIWSSSFIINKPSRSASQCSNIDPCARLSNIDTIQTSSKIYPNPISTNILNICTPATESKKNIEIYDTKGILVKTIATYDAEISVNVDDLVKGIYIVKIYDNNLLRHTEKLFKNGL